MSYQIDDSSTIGKYNAENRIENGEDGGSKPQGKNNIQEKECIFQASGGEASEATGVAKVKAMRLGLELQVGVWALSQFRGP